MSGQVILSMQRTSRDPRWGFRQRLAGCQGVMGQGDAAIAVAAMLERSGEITSAGGYLRALTAKARAGEFSTGPLVMAQMKRNAAA